MWRPADLIDCIVSGAERPCCWPMVLTQSSVPVQAMSQMLPTLGLTATCLEERLCSLPQADGRTGVTEAAELDAAFDAVQVR